MAAWRLYLLIQFSWLSQAVPHTLKSLWQLLAEVHGEKEPERESVEWLSLCGVDALFRVAIVYCLAHYPIFLRFHYIDLYSPAHNNTHTAVQCTKNISHFKHFFFISFACLPVMFVPATGVANIGPCAAHTNN